MSSQNNLFPDSAFFLKTKTPTETIRDQLQFDNLPEVEKSVLHFKKKWLATPYAKQLAAIISRVIEDRKGDPISNVVCLGMSGDGVNREVQQLVVFSQIAAHLATANPDLLNNIVYQDPILDFRNFEWRWMVENHGCKVVKTPVAFKEVRKNTFVFSPYVRPDVLLLGLEDQPVDQLTLFVGNDVRFWIDGKGKSFSVRPVLAFFGLLWKLEWKLTFDRWGRMGTNYGT